MKTIKLNDRTEIPVLGLGTYQLTGQMASQALETAWEIGYRHFDTADVYENHRRFGKFFKEMKIKREELFLTSKIWYGRLQPDRIKYDMERFFQELETNYLDLLLIHWPNKNIPIANTLKTMDELKNQGLIKAIGVSNFTVKHLEEALQIGVEITNNQVEFHPSFNQKELLEFCQKNNIALTAYSPLGQGADLNLPIIKKLAEKYKVSATQIILNWLRQKNIIAIPRSSKPEHLADNFKSLDWEMKSEDVIKIDQIEINKRLIKFDISEFDY